MSRRQTDMNAENEMAKFMDKNFYAPLLKEGKFFSITRITDINMQKAGADVSLLYKQRFLYIDEKAQLYYINKALPTFAFELEYLYHGVPHSGWLLNSDLLTTHYFLLWPFAAVENASQLSASNITEVYGVLLQKKTLLDYLKGQGLNTVALADMAKEMRFSGQIGRKSIGYQDMHLYISNPARYQESPINLVIRRSVLENLATAKYSITQQGFTRIK